MLTAFSMRSSTSLRIWLAGMFGPCWGTRKVRRRGTRPSRLGDQGADRVPGDGALDVAFLLEVEDQDGQLALPAEADRRHVHGPQVVLEHLGVGQLLVAD